MPLIYCYNKGCGKMFDPDKNEDESCRHHPGPVYFHDAYKIWKCCDKKFTDFGAFLEYPGCKRSAHNSEKSDDIQKLPAQTEIRPEKEDEVIVWKGLNQPAERHVEPAELVELTVEITSGAAAAVEKARASSNGQENSGIVIGAACKQNSCKEVYNGPESNLTECMYHPGKAIFHEGMKYWSCCNRKTSNFSAFLEQPGCTKGTHEWSHNQQVDKIRQDWFSGAGYIHVNVYCKGAVGEECTFESDGLLLRTVVVHGFGNKVTKKDYELFGRIVPGESKVIVGERKIEIVLKQADNTGWPRLEYEVAESAS
uniref:Cysteine and histidine-rich domain-containing protein n=1 Tax=Panagrolaimus sp. JU765 TaxID=591449 RepID=A0AC34QMG8_9BILA